MKFNLGDKVRIKSNDIIGIIISRGYNEYLDENDKEQSFIEYQIEADKYYQCNEDEIELIKIGQVLQSIYNIPPQIKINSNEKDFIENNTSNIKFKLETDNGGNTLKIEQVEDDVVNHPRYYCDGNIEVIDFIIDKKLNFNRGNVIKYVSRAGKKDINKEIEDLEKARFYLNKEIEILKGE